MIMCLTEIEKLLWPIHLFYCLHSNIGVNLLAYFSMGNKPQCGDIIDFCILDTFAGHNWLSLPASDFSHSSQELWMPKLGWKILALASTKPTAIAYLLSKSVIHVVWIGMFWGAFGVTRPTNVNFMPPTSLLIISVKLTSFFKAGCPVE